MAHHADGQHWRDLGKSKSVALPDKSTGAILEKLATPQKRNPVASHAGVASVGADGIKPRAHDCADCGPNADANDAFNQATKPRRETTRPDQLVAAGITGNYGR